MCYMVLWKVHVFYSVSLVLQGVHKFLHEIHVRLYGLFTSFVGCVTSFVDVLHGLGEIHVFYSVGVEFLYVFWGNS